MSDRCPLGYLLLNSINIFTDMNMSSFLDELFDMTDAHFEKCIKIPGRVMKSKHSMEKLQSDMGTFRKRD